MQIEVMVPLSVCSGGVGIVSEVKADVEEEPVPVIASTSAVNSNTVAIVEPSTSAIPSVSAPPPAAPQGPLMNNGGRDTSNDIQKLQQQLQDIKEQVCIEKN